MTAEVAALRSTPGSPSQPQPLSLARQPSAVMRAVREVARADALEQYSGVSAQLKPARSRRSMRSVVDDAAGDAAPPPPQPSPGREHRERLHSSKSSRERSMSPRAHSESGAARAADAAPDARLSRGASTHALRRGESGAARAEAAASPDARLSRGASTHALRKLARSRSPGSSRQSLPPPSPAAEE